MAIKHEDVVVKGDLLTSTMWNKVHVIEDMTIKGIHIDSLQIGTDHLINDCVTTAKLAIQDYLDLVNRLTDPVLAKGRLWFREDLTKLRFSPDGVAVEELAWVGDLNSHATATPIDHPDLSVTSAKLADSAVGTTKLANLAVTSTKLADSSVTSTKLADLAVTPVKLSFGTWEKVVETEVTGTAVTEITVTGLDLDVAKDHYFRQSSGRYRCGLKTYDIQGECVMVKGKRIVVDAKTGRRKIEKFDFRKPKAEVKKEEEGINLEEVKKLLKYAKLKGWI